MPIFNVRMCAENHCSGRTKLFEETDCNENIFYFASFFRELRWKIKFLNILGFVLNFFLFINFKSILDFFCGKSKVLFLFD